MDESDIQYEREVNWAMSLDVAPLSDDETELQFSNNTGSDIGNDVGRVYPILVYRGVSGYEEPSLHEVEFVAEPKELHSLSEEQQSQDNTQPTSTDCPWSAVDRLASIALHLLSLENI